MLSGGLFDTFCHTILTNIVAKEEKFYNFVEAERNHIFDH